MNKIPWYQKNFWLGATLLITLALGFWFIRLAERPFGMLFWGIAYLLAFSVILLLSLSSLRLLRAAALWKKIPGALLGIFTLFLTVSLIFLTVDGNFFDFRLSYRLAAALAPYPQNRMFKDLPEQVSPEQWQADLQYLADTIEKRHVRSFPSLSPKIFHKQLDDVQAVVPQISEDKIKATMMAMVAALHDGHSQIPPFQAATGFHAFPLKLYWFSDGLYVIDAAREYRRAVGARIVKIGNSEVDAVFLKFKTIIPAENDQFKKQRFAHYVLIPELLHAAEFIDTPAQCEILLANEADHYFSITLRPASVFPFVYWQFLKTVEQEISPAIPNPRAQNYWFQYRDDSRILYFQFNSVQNQPGGESIAQFARRLENFVNTHEIERFVIDLRNNGGGNNQLLRPLVRLARHPKINQPGKLYVIIGRRSFSAAISFAAELERRTAVIFAGEPAGNSPNHCGDAERFFLPNSRILVMLSTRYWQQSLAGDRRTTILPDIAVDYRYQDYRDGRDPVMEAILAYRPPAYETVSLDSSRMTNLSGSYLLSPLQTLQLVPKGQRLQLTISDIDTFVQAALYPLSPTRFRSDIADVELQILPKPDGTAQLSLHWKALTLPLSPLPAGYRSPVDLLEAGELDAGIAGLRDAAARGTQFDSRLEFKLNDLGYRYLNQGNHDAALKILALNVELFPTSANTHDSLGEAYLASGNRELAIRLYRESLAINYRNINALEMLKQLGAAEKD